MHLSNFGIDPAICGRRSYLCHFGLDCVPLGYSCVLRLVAVFMLVVNKVRSITPVSPWRRSACLIEARIEPFCKSWDDSRSCVSLPAQICWNVSMNYVVNNRLHISVLVNFVLLVFHRLGRIVDLGQR